MVGAPVSILPQMISPIQPPTQVSQDWAGLRMDTGFHLARTHCRQGTVLLCWIGDFFLSSVGCGKGSIFLQFTYSYQENQCSGRSQRRDWKFLGSWWHCWGTKSPQYKACSTSSLPGMWENKCLCCLSHLSVEFCYFESAAESVLMRWGKIFSIQPHPSMESFMLRGIIELFHVLAERGHLVIYRLGNWGSEKLSKLPTKTELISTTTTTP